MSLAKRLDAGTGSSSFTRLTLFQAIALPALTLATAVFLFTLCAPAFEQHLPAVLDVADGSALIFSGIARAVEVLIYAHYNILSSTELLAVVVLSRSASAIVLAYFFALPTGVVVGLVAVEALVVYVPMRLVFDEPVVRTVGGRVGSGAKALEKETSLTATLTFIGAAFLGAGVYVAGKTFLPELVVSHFDGIRRVPAAPLPLIVLGMIPPALALQELVFRAGLTKALVLTVFIAAISDGPRLLLIRGADLQGVVAVIGLWSAILSAVALGLQSVLA
ncbi:hypothetical protein PYCC9005_002841 [Savitreella phatthalungensis]